MKTNLYRAAFVAALLGGTALAMAPAMAQDKPAAAAPSDQLKISSAAIAKPFNEAVKAMQANDMAGALKIVQDMKALPKRTPADDYLITKLEGVITVNTGDHATAETAYATMADSPVLPASERPEVLRLAIALASEQQHYDRAAKYAKAALDANLQEPAVFAAAADATFRAGDMAAAQQMAQKSIDLSTAAGKRPDQIAYETILQVQVKQNNHVAAAQTLETLAVTYGDPEEWGQAVSLAMGTAGATDIDEVNFGRLLLVIGKGESSDYTVSGASAMKLGYLGDAVLAADHGGTSLGTARAKAAADQKSLTGLAAQAERQNGAFNLALAQSQYGYGQYPAAEASARRALAKGGLKDNNEVQLVLGQSLFQQGKYADALAAFKTVGGSAASQKAGKLWAAYTQQKITPVTAAAQ